MPLVLRFDAPVYDIQNSAYLLVHISFGSLRKFCNSTVACTSESTGSITLASVCYLNYLQTDQVLKRADELPTHQTDQNWQVSQRKGRKL